MMSRSGRRVYDAQLHTQSAQIFMYKHTINSAFYTARPLFLWKDSYISFFLLLSYIFVRPDVLD